MNWGRLVEYAGKMEEKILINRLGYVFELLKEQVNTPDSFLEELQGLLSGNIYYLEKNKKGKFNGKWKIIADPRLERAAKGV